MRKDILDVYASRRDITPEAAEAEVVAIIGRVSRAVAARYRFGYHDAEDMAQEATIEALEVIEEGKYDPGRPLENFLYRHLRRRLSNFKRKYWARMERPCSCCDVANPPAEPCKKFEDWRRRNATKRNIMRPIGMGQVNDEREVNMRDESEAHEEATIRELRSMIDRRLPVSLRADYLRLLDGRSIPAERRESIREAVSSILRPDGEGE